MTNQAIYLIVNKTNNMFYVGSALNFRHRWTQHKTDLNRNVHDNSYLQAGWNKYGQDNFELRILEYVEDKVKLIEREQYWIDNSRCYDRSVGYNLNKWANSRLGSKWSDASRKKFSEKKKGNIISAETKKKMSEAQLKRRHIQSTKIKGRFHSEETKYRLAWIIRHLTTSII